MSAGTRRLVLTLLGCGGIAAAQPPASDADRIAVTRAMLAFYAGNIRVPHGLPAGRRTCVATRPIKQNWDGSLDQRKHYHLQRLTDPILDEDGKVQTRPVPVLSEAEVLDGVPRETLPERDGDAAEGSRAARDAAFEIVKGRPQPPLRQIERDWLSGGEVLGEKAGCVDRLALSSPEISGRFAFITVSHSCGMLCALNATYLLERRTGGWQVIDGDIHAIS